MVDHRCRNRAANKENYTIEPSFLHSSRTNKLMLCRVWTTKSSQSKKNTKARPEKRETLVAEVKLYHEIFILNLR